MKHISTSTAGRLSRDSRTDTTNESSSDGSTETCVRVSGFLLLPRELRDRIYMLIITEEQRPNPPGYTYPVRPQCNTRPHPGIARRFISRRSACIWPLFFISKQIYLEAREIFFTTRQLGLELRPGSQKIRLLRRAAEKAEDDLTASTLSCTSYPSAFVQEETGMSMGLNVGDRSFGSNDDSSANSHEEALGDQFPPSQRRNSAQGDKYLPSWGYLGCTFHDLVRFEHADIRIFDFETIGLDDIRAVLSAFRASLNQYNKTMAQTATKDWTIIADMHYVELRDRVGRGGGLDEHELARLAEDRASIVQELIDLASFPGIYLDLEIRVIGFRPSAIDRIGRCSRWVTKETIRILNDKKTLEQVQGPEVEEMRVTFRDIADKDEWPGDVRFRVTHPPAPDWSLRNNWH